MDAGTSWQLNHLVRPQRSQRCPAAGTSTTPPEQCADWICWQRNVDPISGVTYGTTGKVSTGSGFQFCNITDSAIARYLGVKPHITTSAADANVVATALDSIFRCPSDNLYSRITPPGGSGSYRYSYSMNQGFAVKAGGAVISQANGTAGIADGARDGFTFTGKISSIKRPSDHILLIDEDELTIDDGAGVFHADTFATGATPSNVIAARHEMRFKTATINGAGNGYTVTQDARGNAAFCDGHGEFISRKEALRAIHTGSPLPDGY